MTKYCSMLSTTNFLLMEMVMMIIINVVVNVVLLTMNSFFFSDYAYWYHGSYCV